MQRLVVSVEPVRVSIAAYSILSKVATIKCYDRMNTLVLALAASFYIVSLLACGIEMYALPGRIFPKSAVVSAHPLASKVGADIMRKGGNAADAAVAVHFALAVVYPNAGNLGGGGFFLWRSFNGAAKACDFRETAPASATRDMFLDSAGMPVTKLSLEGHRACGVPGSVAGMWEVHKTLGRLRWQECLQPAIDLASKGFRITTKQAADLNKHRAELIQWNKEGCALVRLRPWRPGMKLVQTELAQTLRRIQVNGRDGFYKGRTAELLVQEMQRGSGIITSKDLETYVPVWRQVVRGRFRQYDILSMPPPSSGGIALLQLLTMWEQQTTRGIPNIHSADHVHLMAECERRVFADRAEWMGDPDFVRVPAASLLDTTYLRNRMNSYSPDTATPSSVVHAGAITQLKEHDQTTHFSIVDSFGNAVAQTTTLNDSYGNKVMVRGAGFLLNNEMDDFSVKPGVPNMYGLVGSHANAIAAGKRMLSSMTPTIVENNGSLRFVVGTPGGSTIITSVFQTIVNVVDYGMTMQQSVNTARFHHQWLPDRITIENRCLRSNVRAELKYRGHTLITKDAIGRVDAIERDTDGRLHTGADPRGDDTADGF